jgi:hypothetical protein
MRMHAHLSDEWLSGTLTDTLEEYEQGLFLVELCRRCNHCEWIIWCLCTLDKVTLDSAR